MSGFTQTQAELLYAMPKIGAAMTTTVTTGTSALLGGNAGTNPPFELPHNYFSTVGKALLMQGSGVFVIGTSAPTVKVGIYANNTSGTTSSGSTLLCSTGAFTTVASITGQFCFQAFITCTDVGVSGTLQPFGLLHWGPANLTTTVGVPDYTMGTGSTTPVTFSTIQTTPVYIEPMAWWSTSSTSPTMTLTQFFVWGLN